MKRLTSRARLFVLLAILTAASAAALRGVAWYGAATAELPLPHEAPAAPRPAPEFLAPSRVGGGIAGIADGVEGGVSGGVSGGVAGGIVGGVVGGLPDAFFFTSPGTNPTVSTEDDALSTFGLDVDTASYSLARGYIRRGELPPPQAVRVEDFVNALPQAYPAPVHDTFAIAIEGAPSPFAEGRALLRVGLRAKVVPHDQRKPAHLTFVVDVSGSMNEGNRLGLVRRGLRQLVERLDDRDWIGIVVYGSDGRVLLAPTSVGNRTAILDAVDGLVAEGSTNLEEGLDLGYAMAERSFDPTANNRVVLCTDGVANNGITDPALLLKRTRARARKGVDLVALGFGMGNYNDALLQKLADEGDGQYAYIDDVNEARRFFLGDLTGVLETVARDARAQVEFDKSRVESYRLVGYEKRDIADEDFRNDAVDAGEVNAGQSATALYELTLRPGSGPIGSVRVRFADPETGVVTEQTQELRAEALRGSFSDASAGFQATVLTARFAEHLRHSPFVPAGEPLADVLTLAEAMPVSMAPCAELVATLRDAVRIGEAGARADGPTS